MKRILIATTLALLPAVQRTPRPGAESDANADIANETTLEVHDADHEGRRVAQNMSRPIG